MFKREKLISLLTITSKRTISCGSCMHIDLMEAPKNLEQLGLVLAFLSEGIIDRKDGDYVMKTSAGRTTFYVNLGRPNQADFGRVCTLVYTTRDALSDDAYYEFMILDPEKKLWGVRKSGGLPEGYFNAGGILDSFSCEILQNSLNQLYQRLAEMGVSARPQVAQRVPPTTQKQEAILLPPDWRKYCLPLSVRAEILKQAGKPRQLKVQPKKPDYDEDLVRSLVKMLSARRADERQSWMEVGQCLHDVDPELLPIWIEFSQRTWRFDVDACLKKWELFSKQDGFGLPSLHRWAKLDSPMLYFSLMQKRQEPKVEKIPTILKVIDPVINNKKKYDLDDQVEEKPAEVFVETSLKQPMTNEEFAENIWKDVGVLLSVDQQGNEQAIKDTVMKWLKKQADAVRNFKQTRLDWQSFEDFLDDQGFDAEVPFGEQLERKRYSEVSFVMELVDRYGKEEVEKWWNAWCDDIDLYDDVEEEVEESVYTSQIRQKISF